MLAKVDNREVINTTTLLIGEEQSAWVEVMALEWRIKLKIVIEYSSNVLNQSVASISTEDDYGVLTLSNFTGSATAFSSFKIGETEGRDVFLSILGHTVGELTQLTLQFTVQGDN